MLQLQQRHPEQSCFCPVVRWVSRPPSQHHRHPPQQLKQELVTRGLQQASIGADPSAEQILAAVGDPFQAFTAGVLVGAVSAGQPLLLGGGCQMLAVLALAMQALPARQREYLAAQVLIALAIRAQNR